MQNGIQKGIEQAQKDNEVIVESGKAPEQNTQSETNTTTQSTTQQPEENQGTDYNLINTILIAGIFAIIVLIAVGLAVNGRKNRTSQK